MRELLQEALDAGAIGMSSGLAYAPAEHAPPAEIEALAALLHPAGALYTTHMRNEGEHVLDSLEESFAVGRSAGDTGRDLASQDDRPGEFRPHRRDAARHRRGDRRAGGRARRLPLYRVIDRAERGSGRARLEGDGHLVKERAGAGRTRIAAIAADWGVSIEDAVNRLQPAGAIYWTMDEPDVQRVLSFPHTMIGSDGLPHDFHPHPRLWGTFPRVLGHYCRDLGLFGLEEAVRKMTGLPAARFGLSGRGAVTVGGYADITVFDPAAVIDRATFEKPTTPAAGIEHVFVNGVPVWAEGKPSGERPGRALRRQQMQADAG